MLKIKLLPDKQIKPLQVFITDICAHQPQWYFTSNNDSAGIQLEIKSSANSKWFVAYENEKLVACVNLVIIEEKAKSGLKYFENPKIGALLKSEQICEVSRMVIDPQHTCNNILQHLFLEVFKFCAIHHYSIFACTYEPYLKNFYNSIKFPLKIDEVSQHKSGDLALEAGFYIASYEKEELKIVIGYLERSLSEGVNHLNHDVEREKVKFQNVVDRVLHDIRSPLSSLSMIVGVLKGVNEEDIHSLKNAITRITDVANNLQKEYGRNGVKSLSSHDDGKYDALLVSTALLEILGEKRYQYKLLNIRFESSFSQKSNFAFADMAAAVFKRMVSNVLNNAVDAVHHNDGIITVRLSVEGDLIKIVVQDNGRGIPEEVIQHILGTGNNETEAPTHLRTGLMQVRHTLEENNGRLLLSSGKEGSKVTLLFPKISKPAWLTDTIDLKGDDLVVILDDEPSIHGAWNSRFRLHTKRVAIKHFESGREVVNFINYLPDESKKKIFLLADYELQEQDIDGLEVIEQLKGIRSVLVTSHHASKKLREDVEKLGIKLLPKMLAPEVTITVDEKIEPLEGKKEVSIIFADDDEEFVTNMIRSLFAGQYVETFFDPEHLLQDILKYKKDTKICLDNHFEKSGIKGVEVAERLYEKGFTNLYMLSGNMLDASEKPSYLRVILKNDLDGIKQMRDA